MGERIEGMATQIDSVSIVGLRRQHLIQLEAYIEWAERSQTYYGRKDYFDQRHADLREWIESALTATAGCKIKEFRG